MQTRIHVVLWGMDSHLNDLAEAVAAGAREVDGTEVTISQARGSSDAGARSAHVPPARPEGPAQANAFIFGIPAVAGNTREQARALMDRTGGSCRAGCASGDVAGYFASAPAGRGGNGSSVTLFRVTLLSQDAIFVEVPRAGRAGGGDARRAAARRTATGIPPVDGPAERCHPTELAMARLQGRFVARAIRQVKLAAQAAGS